MNGVLWISGGVCSLAGSVVHPMIAEISSGAVSAQSRNCSVHVLRVLHGMEHPGERHHRTHRVALERERGDHAEVAATAADGPEQVGVRVRRRRPHLAVGAHHLGGQQVVDRHPVLAADPPLPTAEREPGDAGVGDDAARGDEPEGLGLVVHVADQGSTLDAHRPSLRVDVNAVHQGEVEEQAAVDAREPGDRVTAAANGEEESVLAGEVDRADHVGGAGGAHDQRRFPRMHRVVRRADQRISGVPGREHVTPDRHTEFLEALVADLRLGALQRRHRHCHRIALLPWEWISPNQSA